MAMVPYGYGYGQPPHPLRPGAPRPAPPAGLPGLPAGLPWKRLDMSFQFFFNSQFPFFLNKLKVNILEKILITFYFNIDTYIKSILYFHQNRVGF